RAENSRGRHFGQHAKTLLALSQRGFGPTLVRDIAKAPHPAHRHAAYELRPRITLVDSPVLAAQHVENLILRTRIEIADADQKIFRHDELIENRSENAFLIRVGERGWHLVVACAQSRRRPD